MFKKHPKGLIVAFFANMGERFGFYTMMAILVLFLQAKYGLSEDVAGSIYSWFYFAIYALALLGGLLADYTSKYKTVILFGQIIMFAGYALLAFPGLPLAITIVGLGTIALGNGLFKGNLQAVVGQLYDDEKYAGIRDSAFMIFYMGINVGAFFAPFVATGIRNWWLESNGFLHDGALPALCHQFLDGTLQDPTQLQTLANQVSLGGAITDLSAFAQSYLDIFARGYNYAFMIAAIAMVISLVVYMVFNKMLPNKEKSATQQTISFGEKPMAIVPALLVGILAAVGISLLKATATGGTMLDGDNIATGAAFGLFAVFVTWIITISRKEERQRVIALTLVFLVVIFFWMSFHQNGLTLTFFARDYTVKAVDPYTYMFFTLENILSVIALIAGLVIVLGRKRTLNTRLMGAALLVAGSTAAFFFFRKGEAENPISPEVFQSFNPLFIVTLTFIVMGFFSWLNKRGKEPSTPRKIGIGMIIAAVGFLIILVASLNLVSPHELKIVDETGVVKFSPVPDSSRVMPYWLISSYLVLTVAELFLSPIGLSFVSKVAPGRFQGLMQGGWLLATAVGNKLLFVGSTFWGTLDLWKLWLIFIVCCLLSALFIFSIMKRLERITK
ncbi:MAG: MFS transporter [Bacteroidales bacterium]|jgi:POT family proton-dependent oligopeptide transporter|nr:MFS transporter [Bacteroidales bacterium]MDD2571081.1 MFS transporter [Bacteroidales bacterium]MDD3384763.1 MFS transporter [Bacteroidales bacterium]MDD3811500.1 MFS transporter [Bacteroidales bacterium]MDD4813164.1 MFS transporter [Bacteroidales bacterium]